MKLPNVKEIFRQNTGTVAYVFLLSVVLFIPSLLAPIYQKVFTDYIFTDNNNEWLAVLAILMGATSIFAGIVNWIQNGCFSRLSNKIEAGGINRYMLAVFRSPMKFFSQKDSYTLLSRSERLENISTLLTDDILPLLFDTFKVVFYLFMMMRINLSMTLVVIVLVAVGVVLGKIGAFLRDKFTTTEDDELSLDELTTRDERLCTLGLQNIETFKSTTSESALLKRLWGAKTAVINAKRDDDFKEAGSQIESLPEILFLNILLLISANMIMDRSFSIGTYLEFQAYACAFFYPLSGVLSIRRQFKGFEEKLTVFFKELENNDDGETAKHISVKTVDGKRKLDGHIEFKNVTFGYDGAIPVIKDFSLSIKQGQRIAIVGKSGTGKTTLLKLLQGFYEPDHGEVTIDGIPASKIDGRLFKNSVGCANQEIAFFSASIRENITLWDESVTDAMLCNSAKDACIHTHISSLEGAYEYLVAENGSNMSRGQQQRLELARALLYDPSVVMLDEVLASIDPANRLYIEERLTARGCTVIKVTHLLSLIKDYDEIIVLGKAEVIARGTHDDLLKSSPYYKLFFEAEGLTAKIW